LAPPFQGYELHAGQTHDACALVKILGYASLCDLSAYMDYFAVKNQKYQGSIAILVANTSNFKIKRHRCATQA
jgi:hypothetical protein